MRWLALFLAMLAASTASAKTLVVRMNGDGASAGPKYMAMHLTYFEQMMKARGGTYTDIHMSQTRTEWMRTGLQQWAAPNTPNARTEQFDCVVIFNYDVNNTIPAGSAPDSLTLVAKWPTVPVVFFGIPAYGGGKWTSASNNCSTGVKSLGTPVSTVRRNYVLYPVGSTNPWKNLSVAMDPAVVLGTQPAGTQLRPVIALNYSATVGGGLPSVSTINRADADSTGYTAAGNDSVVLWVRTVTSVGAVANPKPLIFADIGGAGSPVVGIMAAAMQMADSASGGRVWDAAGARPIQAAFAVSATVGKGHYSNSMSSTNETHLLGGAFCRPDSCDTTNVLSGLDSLGTLTGLKTTFYIDPCSLASYPYVKNWLYRAGKYRVGMQTHAGTVASRAMGAADSLSPCDALGHLRTRHAAQSTGNCSLVSDSALVTCNVRRGFNVLRNYFGDGALDRSILPAFSDWSPVAWTRNGGSPGRDSMAWALHKAGVRAIVIRPEMMNTNPNVSAYIVSGTLTYNTGAAAPAADPWGYGPHDEVIPIYADPASPGRTIGTLKIVAERNEDNLLNIRFGYASHDVRTEWTGGLLTSMWYQEPIRYYNHNFWTRTQVLRVSLGRLGGSAGATTVPSRSAWWTVKHTHNEFQAANNLGWVDTVSGQRRGMFEWAFVEDLEP